MIYIYNQNIKWYDMIWYDIVWFDMKEYNTILYKPWFNITLHNTRQYNVNWYHLIWFKIPFNKIWNHMKHFFRKWYAIYWHSVYHYLFVIFLYNNKTPGVNTYQLEHTWTKTYVISILTQSVLPNWHIYIYKINT